MTLNTTYSLDSDVAVKGQVADSRVTTASTITKVLEADTEAGVLVTLGTGGKAAVIGAQDDYVLGATRHSTTIVQADDGTVTYKADQAAPIFQEGPIWLYGREAINEGDLVYGVINTNPGDVKKTSGADTTTASIGRAETTTTGAGLVRVYLRPAQQA